MKTRVATLIPVLLVAWLAASSAVLYWFAIRDVNQTIERDSVDELNRVITHLQNMLDSQLTQDNLQGADLSLSVTAMHPNIRTLLLSDENDKVLLANHFAWRGKPATEVTAYDPAIAARIHHHRARDIQFDSQHRVRGYYPITISVGKLNVGIGGGLSSRVGVLFVEMDFAAKLAAARNNALMTFSGYVLSAFFVTLAIGLLLHRGVSVRVGALKRATSELVTGNLEARAHLQGSDDLAELGNAFDHMAESLHAQRKKIEEHSARLNEAQRIAHLGSWELDLQTNRLVWSDEIFRIFEIDPTRFGATYEAFLNAIHPDDREAVNKAYTGSLSDRKPYEIIHRLQMADGRIKWVHERCESTFDEAGKPLRSVGTVQDVTELHDTEQELRRHREHLEEIVRERTEKLERMRRDTEQTSRMLRTVLDTAPFRIFWKDLDCRYLGCNDLFAADAGKKTPLELVGKNDFDMAWKATAELYRADDQAVMASGVPKLNFEEPMDFPDGSRIWLSTSKVPLRDTSGQVIGILGAYEIITARKLAEAELVQAKENAERANKAKSEFLARMSHELRTPMNAILGFAQILEIEPIGAEPVSFAQEIRRAGDHLLELINELLDLSRIEAGKLVTVLQPVNLQKSVDDAIQITQSLMTARSVTLDRKCDPNVTVLADPTRLRQILVNLLSNAAKYNRAGGRVVVACRANTEERLLITVSDTGPGIAPEKLALLFKPFERLGAEFSSVDGTGIGLALSKQLAALMGGALGVESTPGQGSTFWLELPTAQPAPDATHAATTPQSQRAGQRTVLYVEDNAANLRVVEAIFRRHPHLRMVSATHGEQGLELARRYTPDVILLDIHLPDMDGYAMFEQLRKDPTTRTIPVLALSADAMPIDIERGLAAGFRHYVTKPIRVDLLLAALDDALAASVSRC